MSDDKQDDRGDDGEEINEDSAAVEPVEPAVDDDAGDGDDDEQVPEPYEPTTDVPDPLLETYQKLLRKTEGLPELPMKSALVERTLAGLELEEMVWCLDQILRGALWGKPGGMETMMATIWWLIEMRRDDDYETIKGIFETAHEARRASVLDLFREVPPHQALADGQELPEVRFPSGDDEVTLGERRAMAAGPKHRLLERLLMDPDPLVIRKLLDNPHIRLEDIQVIATRRPTTPEILQEIVFHPRWFRRFEVRESIVRNPYADTGLVLKLLPTLGIRPLRRIKFSGDLHPIVQESAKRLVKLREERTAPWGV